MAMGMSLSLQTDARCQPVWHLKVIEKMRL